MGLGWFARCDWTGWYGCVSEAAVKGGPHGLDSTPPDTPSISPANLLTEAHGAPATRHGLADQALAGVTDVAMVTGLPQPPGTHLAAIAAVQHQGHPQRAPGWWPGTGARCRAQLGTHLQRETSLSLGLSSWARRPSPLATSLPGSVQSAPWPQSHIDLALNAAGPMALPKRQQGIVITSKDSGLELQS